MPWSIDSTTRTLTHTGTNRDVFVVDSTLPATWELRAQSNDYTDNTKLAVRLSGDGRSGFELGVEGANVVIRKITYGVVGSSLATSAHGLSAGETFTIRARGTGDELEAAIVKSSGAVVAVTYNTTDFLHHRYWGVVGDENNALVQALSWAERVAQEATVEDVGLAIIGGDLYASYDGSTWRLVAGSIMPREGKVSMAPLDGLVYMVGGGRAKVFDPVARTVTDWIPTSGSLPGQTESGTTTATILIQFRGRLMLAGIESEPNNAYFSAIAEPLTWDTAELVPGRAVALGVGRNVTVGDPIVGAAVLSNNALLIGCSNSIYILQGDPDDLASDLTPVALNTGCSGVRAITTAEDGLGLVHSPEGLYLVPQGGAPVALSRDVLTERIEYPRTDRSSYQVCLLRDPARAGILIFLNAGAGSTHFWYDERTGGYRRGRGGFFPEKYAYQPTCGMVWRGRPVIGTSDGRIVEFDDDATTDDSTAIESFYHFALDAPGVEQDIIIRRLAGYLSDDSDSVKLTYYGGETMQTAFNTTTRWTIAGPATLRRRGQALTFRARAPAITVKVAPAASGDFHASEEWEVQIETGRRTSPIGKQAALAASASCTPRVTGTPDPGDEEPTAGPGSTDPTGTPPPPPATTDPESTWGGGVYEP